MSFLLDGDRVPVTKQDRIDLEKLRLMEEILVALNSNKPKEEKKDGMESVGRTRRERGTKPSTGTKTSK